MPMPDVPRVLDTLAAAHADLTSMGADPELLGTLCRLMIELAVGADEEQVLADLELVVTAAAWDAQVADVRLQRLTRAVQGWQPVTVGRVAR